MIHKSTGIVENMMSNRFLLTELSNDKVMTAAKSLDSTGWIEHKDQYCYLKINDEFIHALYPLLAAEYPQLQKPDYFHSTNLVGAHISVIYPEENTPVDEEYIGQIYTFSVCKLVRALYGAVEYYVLTVLSPSLGALRHRHHLPRQPVFKGQSVLFHISIAVKYDMTTRWAAPY